MGRVLRRLLGLRANFCFFIWVKITQVLLCDNSTDYSSLLCELFCVSIIFYKEFLKNRHLFYNSVLHFGLCGFMPSYSVLYCYFSEVEGGAKVNICIQSDILTWKLSILGLYFAHWKTSWGNAVFLHVHNSLSERCIFLI